MEPEEIADQLVQEWKERSEQREGPVGFGPSLSSTSLETFSAENMYVH